LLRSNGERKQHDAGQHEPAASLGSGEPLDKESTLLHRPLEEQ
jgi:hypothetical protein